MKEIIDLVNNDPGQRASKQQNIDKATAGLREQIVQVKDTITAQVNVMKQTLGNINDVQELAMALKDYPPLSEHISTSMDATNLARQEYEVFVLTNPEGTSRADIVEGFFEKVQNELVAENLHLNALL
jgi:hypothetical protein